MTAFARPSLRDGRFRLLWSAGAVSAVGDGVTSVAVPLIAVSRHAGVGQVAALTALSWAPFLLGPFLGTWVDRRSRPLGVTIGADVARGLALGSVPLAAVLHDVSLAQLYVVVGVAGAGAALSATSGSRVFVMLLSRPDFVAAQGLIATSRAIADVVGPSVGGLLVQVVGAPFAVGVDAVSFFLSAALLGRLGLPAPVVADREADRRLREGFRVLFTDPVLRACLGSAATVNLFTLFVSGGLTVLFARRELGLSPGAIGVALGLGSVGGVLAAAIAPTVAARLGAGRTAALGALVFPLSLLVLAAARPGDAFVLFAGAEFVSGVGVMLFDVPLNAISAATVPDAVRSRVTGAFSAVNYGTRPLGAATGGIVASALGLRPTIVIAALGGALSVLWLIRSPIRRITRIDDVVRSGDG